MFKGLTRSFARTGRTAPRSVARASRRATPATAARTLRTSARTNSVAFPTHQRTFSRTFAANAAAANQGGDLLDRIAALGDKVEEMSADVVFPGAAGHLTRLIFVTSGIAEKRNIVEKDFQSIQAVLDQTAELVTAVESPVTQPSTLNKLVDLLSDKCKLDELTTRFLKMLITKQKMKYLPEVLKNYTIMMSSFRKEVTAHVTTAEPLTPSQAEYLDWQLNKFYVQPGQTLELKLETNPSLVQGLTLEIGDMFLDLSAKTELRKVEESVLGRLSDIIEREYQRHEEAVEAHVASLVAKSS